MEYSFHSGKTNYKINRKHDRAMQSLIDPIVVGMVLQTTIFNTVPVPR